MYTNTVNTPIAYSDMIDRAVFAGLDETYVDAWCCRLVDFSSECQRKAYLFWRYCILPYSAA